MRPARNFLGNGSGISQGGGHDIGGIGLKNAGVKTGTEIRCRGRVGLLIGIRKEERDSCHLSVGGDARTAQGHDEDREKSRSRSGVDTHGKNLF